MPTATRLKNLEKSLTPRQIVMLDLQESRGYPNPVAFARAIVAGEADRGGTLCERVERAVRGTGTFRKDPALNRKVREAVRRALFLSILADTVAIAIAESEAEIMLRTQLVAALALVGLFAQNESGPWPNRVTECRAVAVEQVRRLRVLRSAIRLVENQYFEGRHVLYPDQEAMLEHQVGAAEFLAGLSSDGTHAPEPDNKDTKPNSGTHDSAIRHTAQNWVLLTRAKVHERMDESAATMKIVRDILK